MIAASDEMTLDELKIFRLAQEGVADLPGPGANDLANLP
jgi:hypothetical protein